MTVLLLDTESPLYLSKMHSIKGSFRTRNGKKTFPFNIRNLKALDQTGHYQDRTHLIITINTPNYGAGPPTFNIATLSSHPTCAGIHLISTWRITYMGMMEGLLRFLVSVQLSFYKRSRGGLFLVEVRMKIMQKNG
jgi:hypothetical protein